VSLTPLVFLGLFALGVIATVAVHPRYGIYTYFLAFFMSPTHTWWEDLVPDFRYLLIAGVATFIAVFAQDTKTPGMKWTEIGGFKIFIAFVIWLLPIYIWAVEPEEHWEGIVLYAKHLLISYLIYRVAVDKETIKDFSLVMVVGCAWFGWLAMGKSGRLEGVAGAIADANTLGMHVSTGVMMGGMMFLGFKGHYKWICFACIPLVLNTVILSGSRGAFLGLLSGGIAAAVFCPKTFRRSFSFLSILAVVLFFMLAHEQFLDRITEMFHATEDSEQMHRESGGRLEIAALGWEMAKDHPLGVGHKGTRALSPGYMPDYLLSRGRRSAHNSVMDALVSYGFLGAGLYIMLYLWAAKQLFRLRRIAEFDKDTDVGIFAAMFAAVLAVVFASGIFSNFIFAEVQFWMIGMIAAAVNLPEVRDRSSARPGNVKRPPERRTTHPIGVGFNR
jgi:O-antigen ligase